MGKAVQVLHISIVIEEHKFGKYDFGHYHHITHLSHIVSNFLILNV